MNPLIPLRDAWYFFSRHLSTIALLCLPWVLLENLLAQFIGLWTGESASVPYSLLAGLLLYPLYSAALILLVDARSRGLQPRLADLLAAALRLWPSLAVLTALTSLLILLGLSLLVLPGLWVMVKLAFAEYLLVLRGYTPLAALRGSSEPLRFEPIDAVYSDHDPAFADERPDSHDMLETQELREALAEAVGSVPERLQLVMQLYFVEELNLAEIAATLDVSVPRVHQLKAQALDRLRAELGGMVDIV